MFAYPPTQETVDATLVEVARCTREGVRINTFALDATGHLRRFIEQMTRLNRGKAFYHVAGHAGRLRARGLSRGQEDHAPPAPARLTRGHRL